MNTSLIIGNATVGYRDLGADAVLGDMTKAMPGGDGSLEWTLPGSVAWKHRNVLVPGASVRLRVNGVPVWAGRYCNDPVRHRFRSDGDISCAAAGLNSWLSRYKGFGAPFIDADESQWFRVWRKYDSGTEELEVLEDSGKFTADIETTIRMTGYKDRTYDDYAVCKVVYWLFDGLDLGYHIVGVDFEYKCNLPDTDWKFKVVSMDDPWAATTAEASHTDDQSSWTATQQVDLSSPNHCIGFILIWDSASSNTPTELPWVTIRNVKVYCRPAGGSIDRSITLGQAMEEIATLTGFATEASCDALSGNLTGLMVRPDAQSTGADALRQIAAYDDNPVEYGFYLTDAGADGFFCNALPATVDVTRNTHWIVGERGGEDVSGLERDAEAAPDYVLLPYRSWGVATMSDCRPRFVWYPSDPGTFDANVDVIDEYADRKLSDEDALAFATRLWGIMQAQQWQGEIVFGNDARTSTGRLSPSWMVRPGDRITVPSLDDASGLYVCETNYDFTTQRMTAVIGWPFDAFTMRRHIRKAFRRRVLVPDEHGHDQWGRDDEHGYHYVWQTYWKWV